MLALPPRSDYRRLRAFCLAVAALTTGAGIASAASPTWNGPNIGSTTTTEPFETAAYWSTGIVPGTTSVTSPFTNTDTAIFNATLSTSTAAYYQISLAAPRNIGSIFIDAGTSTRYLIGTTATNAFYLTSGGSITDNGSSVTQYIQTPLILEPAAGSVNGTYSLITNGTVGKIPFQGATISGGLTYGSINLVLGGNYAANTGGGGQLADPVSDGSAGGGISVTKTGLGNWTMTRTSASQAANTYSGPTRINSGILYLDFSNFENGASNTSLTSNLISNSALQLAGGTISMLGQSSGGSATPAATSQSFAGIGGTTLIAGTSSGVVAANNTYNGTAAGPSVTLNLAAINRQNGSTVTFTPPTTGSIQTTNANNSGGTLGGYAVINTNAANVNGGNTWAVSAGDGTNAGAITGLPTASYTTTATAGTTAANYANANIDVTASTAPGVAINPNTLRFNTAATAGNGITLMLTGANVVNSGGILVTSAVGVGTGNTGTTAINTTITGGTLTSGNGQDLILIQNDSGGSSAVVTMASQITDNGGTSISFTKAGNGDLVLSTAATYTGATYIDGGRLRLGVANALPATTALVFANATTAGTAQSFALGLTGFNQTVASLSGANDSVANGYTAAAIYGSGATTAVAILTINGTASTTFGGVIGDTSTAPSFQATSQSLGIVKAGTSTLTLTAPSVYSAALLSTEARSISTTPRLGLGPGQHHGRRRGNAGREWHHRPRDLCS